MENNTPTENYIERAISIVRTARSEAVRQVNSVMIRAHYEIGRLIVQEHQSGDPNAGYGKYILKHLSEKLTKEFGRGFSKRNLEFMRRFYLMCANGEIAKTVFSQSRKNEFKLSWSHYIKLMRIDNSDARHFYELESIANNWSVRELERQFDTALYQRIALSRDKDRVWALSKEGELSNLPKEVIREPYVLEFLGLKEDASYSESDLESAIINHLQEFLLELKRGFTFVGRQKRITFDNQHFFIDLVFYNRILRCFLIIDLKLGKLMHQDIGQMMMYVNYYDREIKLEDENPTIGLLLCEKKNDLVVEYTLPKDNQQIFAGKYETVLPSREILQKLLMEHLSEE